MDLFSGKVVLITGGLGSGGGRPLPLLAETRVHQRHRLASGRRGSGLTSL
jgi:hypothetical protein